MSEPRIVAERVSWALVYKPHGMPSAPLRDNETGTLLEWFLSARPEAASVNGRKPVERGLVHRLDTGTAGLVLVAKNQIAYDRFLESQGMGLIEKRYEAVCGFPEVTGPAFRETVQPFIVPYTLTSRFRPFGPKGREVRAVFPDDGRYPDAGRDYSTTIHETLSIREEGRELRLFRCSLTLGYRHQVRVHLACLGFPIIGDTLYNPVQTGDTLRLTATGISFPDPESGTAVSFSLPPQDRTSR